MANVPAWTVGGRAIPFATLADFTSGDPEPADAPGAVIPVEQIKGPILTVCGAEDLLWSSCRYSAAIAARVHARPGGQSVTTLRYADAGHLVGGLSPYENFATTEGFGGTVNTNAIDAADGYTKLLAWLARQ